MANDLDNRKCPKCGSDAFGQTNLLSKPGNKCAICGLWHEFGTSKESLEKQILVDQYQQKDNRRYLDGL